MAAMVPRPDDCPAQSSRRELEPVRRTRAEAARNYDRLSNCYDTLASSEQRLVDEGLELLDAAAGETVLEIGFGTGHALVKLAGTVGAAGLVCGIDLSPAMVRRSRRRLEAADPEARVELVAGDAVQLPYADARFDALFMSFTLELFSEEDLTLVLGECRRVLRDGGRLTVVSLSKAGGPYPVRWLYERARKLAPVLLDCRPIYTAEAIAERRFGLTTVRTRRMWGMPVELVSARRPVRAPILRAERS